MAKNLEWLFLFMVAFSGYLWLKGGFTTDAQLYFRVGLLVTGLLGFGITKFVSSRASK